MKLSFQSEIDFFILQADDESLLEVTLILSETSRCLKLHYIFKTDF